MRNPAIAVLSTCLYISTQVSWATRIQATRLPTGPTKVVSALSGDATTTYYLEATKNHNHPVGILTSIVDTFINGGTTTEYMTQHLGTHIQDKYAKIQTTSSREYYRIAPTVSSNEHAVRPTGLIGSSLSLEVNGPATTYHTVEQYRTYLDGHYAQLVSSISNIVTDPAFVSATPIFNPRAVSSVDPDEKRGLEELRKTLYSSYDFDIKPTKAYKYNVATRTVGHRKFAVRDPSILERVLENEIEALSRFEDEHSGNSIKLPRSLDLDAVESETVEDIVPAKPDIAIPTWTVGSDGELNIPTPSIEVIQPEKKIEPTVAHRFAPLKKTKVSLDSVTYVGFVDFTTTIDDTVVIFRPKETFQTVNHNLVRPPPIKPSRTSNIPKSFSTASHLDGREKRPKSLPAPPPEQLSNNIDTEPEIISSSSAEHAEEARSSTTQIDENIKKHTSGIDALKSLLGNNKRTRFGATSGSSTKVIASQSSSKSSPSSTKSSSSRPSVRPSSVSSSEQFSSSSLFTQESATEQFSSSSLFTQESAKEQFSSSALFTQEPANEDITEIISTIDPTSDVELVFKTLYTTYTYFTTFFRESTTRVKSREEVISNVMTLTNILKSSEYPSISSSCQLDSSCLFQSTEVADLFSNGFIGRPNTKPTELPRGGDAGRRIAGDELVVPTGVGLEDNAVLRTFYTTYTYFSTLFNDGTTSISTRTEVYSNVQSASVQLDILSPESISILPTQTFEIISSSPILHIDSSSSAAPLRRLEISSVRPVRLQSDLTTPETPTDSEDSTTERPSTDRIPRLNFHQQQTTTEIDEEETTTEWINPTPIITTTSDYQEEDAVQIITAKTPALTEEVTEVVTSATTESEEEVDVATTESIAKTLYTTFTYFTTLFKSGTSVVTSNLETVTNIATDLNVSPSVVEPSVTFFTTFTYWTTSIVPGGSTVITSREETITDILPASVTNDINREGNSVTSKSEVETTQAPELPTTTSNPREEVDEIEIVSTIAPSASIQPAIFTFYSTRYNGDETIVDTILSTSGVVQPSTVVPDLESSEVDVIVSSGISQDEETPTIQPTSSFQDIDDDLVLTSSVEDTTENEGSVAVRPTRVRQRVAFSRPGNTFAPVIRLNIRDRKQKRPFRPRGELSTTVATRTRNSVKPTLIATPASSVAPQPTPSFGGSSRGAFLASSSLLNRGQNRFSSSVGPASATPTSKSIEASISPSRVLINRGSASFQPSSSLNKSSPTVKINPIRLRRPNPFRARFKELQAERLATLRKKNRIAARPTAATAAAAADENERPTVPIPNFPSPPGGVGGVGAPIFISSQTETVRRPKVNADTSIDVPDSVKLRRERARAKIKNLFSRSRPSFNRLNFNPNRQNGQQRRKRQVSTYGAEFGSRTRARHSYTNRRTQIPNEPQYYQDPNSSYKVPFTAFSSFTSKRQTQQRNLDDYFYEDDTDSSFTSSNSVRTPSSSSRQANTNFRRQAPASEVPDTRGKLPSRSRSRSRSRFNPQSSTSPPKPRTRTRTRTRITNFNSRPTTTEATTTKRPKRLRTRTNPRTLSTSSRDRNRFSSSTRDRNRFNTKNRESLFSTGNRQSSVNKHVITNNRPGFRRPTIIDYDTEYEDYNYEDYYDSDIQSSQNQAVPDFITVTHQVPIATVVPVVANGQTEFRDILTTSPSLQAIAATALKSTDVSNSPVIYANAQTIFPQPGIKQILFDALRATETTSITFTPTRINLGFGLQGRKTSFSHIVPTTIYNIETVTTRIVEPIDQGQLLNSLLQQILLGGGVLPSQGINQNPLFNNAPAQVAIQQRPAPTQYITHSSTYVTTITSIESTVLPITLRGKVISTTLIDSSESIITATEFSTETIIHNLVATHNPVAQQILATAPPGQGLNNPLVASLLPALLQAQLANPLAQQQDALLLQKQQQQEELLRIQHEALLQQQQEALIKQQTELLLKQQQEQIFAQQLEKQENALLNEQLLAQINLDDFSDEDLANLDLDSVIDAVINSKGTKAPIHFPKLNLFNTPKPTTVIQQIEPTAETPRTSVITIYKSGNRPGDFTTTLKTITLDSNRRKRDTLFDIRPSKVELVEVTEAPRLNSSLHQHSELTEELFIPELSELFIQSGLVGELETLYIPVMPHQSLQETRNSF